MDFIIVIGIGAILVATGVISPKPKDDEVAEAEVVKTCLLYTSDAADE